MMEDRKTISKRSIDKIYVNSGNKDVFSWMDLSRARKVLDVGCGSGSLAKLLKENNCEVDGISLSPLEMEMAGIYLTRAWVFDLEQGLPGPLTGDQYDYVICSHVLEHIVYPGQLLLDIYTVLKMDGKLIIALPNLMHYRSRIKLLFGEFNYEEAGIWDYTHVKWYTFKSAQQLLKTYNYRCIRADVTGELPGKTFFNLFLSDSTQQRLFIYLKRISKGLFGYQLLFIFQKQEMK